MAKSNCAGYAFNTGVSPCPFEPGKIKGLLLATEQGAFTQLYATNDFIGTLTMSFYAARPNRIYPIGDIVNYESSGGEVQTSQVGYGSTRVTGYSEKQMTFTLDNYSRDMAASLAHAKGTKFYVMFVDDNNTIWGYERTESSNTYMAGVPCLLSVGGQDFATADAAASLTITLYINDYEKMLQGLQGYPHDEDVVSALNGLVFVDVEIYSSVGSTGKQVQVITHYGRENISADVYELARINPSYVFKVSGGVTLPTPTYDEAVDAIVFSTSDNVSTIALQDPQTLYANRIFGLEQW